MRGKGRGKGEEAREEGKGHEEGKGKEEGRRKSGKGR
jgi:hypothetical protein